jgi:hypothetical protein
MMSEISRSTRAEPDAGGSMTADDPNAPAAAPLTRPAHLRPELLGADRRRSAIPKVAGILAIVFASLGLLGTLSTVIGVDDDMLAHGATRASLGAFGTWMFAYVALAAVVFAVHLTAGIQSVRYAASAPRWMTVYGALAIALVVADFIISMTTFPEGSGFLHQKLYEDLVYPRLGLSILALPWPIIALVLMNQQSARLACAAKRI